MNFAELLVVAQSQMAALQATLGAMAGKAPAAAPAPAPLKEKGKPRGKKAAEGSDGEPEIKAKGSLIAWRDGDLTPWDGGEVVLKCTARFPEEYKAFQLTRESKGANWAFAADAKLASPGDPIGVPKPVRGEAGHEDEDEDAYDERVEAWREEPHPDVAAYNATVAEPFLTHWEADGAGVWAAHEARYAKKPKATKAKAKAVAAPKPVAPAPAPTAPVAPTPPPTAPKLVAPTPAAPKPVAPTPASRRTTAPVATSLPPAEEVKDVPVLLVPTPRTIRRPTGMASTAPTAPTPPPAAPVAPTPAAPKPVAPTPPPMAFSSSSSAPPAEEEDLKPAEEEEEDVPLEEVTVEGHGEVLKAENNGRSYLYEKDPKDPKEPGTYIGELLEDGSVDPDAPAPFSTEP